ncbi:MAG: hypothetical protein QOI20_2600, partial [Acidimicrobiaceae bacterium]|nr:hypothetical protein [Acidimicrobiaceae bacterium]
MRRIAVVIGLLAMCLGVGVAAGGPAGAAPGSCHTGTPPVAGASAGVDQQTPRPGEYIFVVCVYPTPVRGLEGRTDVQAAPGSGSGYTWLNFGAGGGVCEYDNSVVGTHAFMCGGASSAGVIMVPPGADGATFFGGAGACAADETSIWA